MNITLDDDGVVQCRKPTDEPSDTNPKKRRRVSARRRSSLWGNPSRLRQVQWIVNLSLRRCLLQHSHVTHISRREDGLLRNSGRYHAAGRSERSISQTGSRSRPICNSSLSLGKGFMPGPARHCLIATTHSLTRCSSISHTSFSEPASASSSG
jgi:hypothetical protein